MSAKAGHSPTECPNFAQSAAVGGGGLGAGFGGEAGVDGGEEVGVGHLGRLGLLVFFEAVVELERLRSVQVGGFVERFQAVEDPGLPVYQCSVDVEG